MWSSIAPRITGKVESKSGCNLLKTSTEESWETSHFDEQLKGESSGAQANQR
jgi:hypothetical protein